MTLTYTRDLEHNYMTMIPAECEGDRYTLNMLKAHAVPHLLQTEVREINGILHLYYRTDGMLSLTNRCLAKRLTGREVERLLETLADAGEALVEYLLDAEVLYLTPETVFLDASGQFWFTGVPGAGADGCLADFLQALSVLIDDEEKEAQQEIHALLSCADSGHFRLRDLIRRRQGSRRHAASDREEALPSEKRDVPGVRRVPSAPPPPARRREAREEEYEEVERAAEYPAADQQPVRPGVITILFAAVLLADIYVRREYVLTRTGNLLSIVILALSLLGAIGSLFLGGEDRPRRKRRTAKRGRGRGARTRTQTARPKKRRVREEVPAYLEALSEAAEDAREAADEDEDAYTTLLVRESASRSAKLYSRGGAQNCHIALDRLPITLGKRSGGADFVLTDASVSRLHAHIARDEEERLYVRDLNSTNGTFLNGVRLQPNESAPLRVGDEVCFGNAVFDYV